ncbi:hypothetical protein BACCAP_02670 [Pseudoflavonifractor capillosus ATCC 29799]|uniref:Uncharacterized protein n=1 Tax=Pseudoflavonifractor capillosus ATCC 29799 TaxID=411467 RepID=A6NWS7_9FIRM|nr:hypothetical protein BACCAP_02670 [Pseudoflavonifractor capillosus ATCC 29799]
MAFGAGSVAARLGARQRDGNLTPAEVLAAVRMVLLAGLGDVDHYLHRFLLRRIRDRGLRYRGSAGGGKGDRSGLAEDRRALAGGRFRYRSGRSGGDAGLNLGRGGLTGRRAGGDTGLDLAGCRLAGGHTGRRGRCTRSTGTEQHQGEQQGKQTSFQGTHGKTLLFCASSIDTAGSEEGRKEAKHPEGRWNRK